MACLQRAVLLRAAAAALVLGAAFGGEHAVGHALARRGAEQAARQATAPPGGDQARVAHSGSRGHRTQLPTAGPQAVPAEIVNPSR
ncbi:MULTISPECIES: hypothetical protein [unclassified Kitasatospora]|uniref:hypothetical protein n=1 Tax=unclassified Kitasatospora TaxID=2633591 RepID=UPI0024762C00|nr:hypothetical protein [Kitasatospora sp. MAP12-44]